MLGIGEKLYPLNCPKYYFLLVKPNFENSNIELTNQIDFNSNRSTVDNLNLNKIDTMFEFVENVKNRNLRGSDFNIN